jgi:hypothetical protein
MDAIKYTWGWECSDPRDVVTKHATIVILRPSINGNCGLEPGIGFVDTKDGWCIFTSFENRSFVSADDKWDEDWLWNWAPELKNKLP